MNVDIIWANFELILIAIIVISYKLLYYNKIFIEHYKYYNFDWYISVFNDKCLNKLDG